MPRATHHSHQQRTATAAVEAAQQRQRGPQPAAPGSAMPLPPLAASGGPPPSIPAASLLTPEPSTSRLAAPAPQAHLGLPFGSLKLAASESEGSKNGSGASPHPTGAPSLPCRREAVGLPAPASPCTDRSTWPTAGPPVAGFPDILFRPTAGPELLRPSGASRAPLQLYCCACGYRGPSATCTRCGLTRWLLAAVTCGLGLACCGAGADVLHSCPRCAAHVATARYL